MDALNLEAGRCVCMVSLLLGGATVWRRLASQAQYRNRRRVVVVGSLSREKINA